VLIAIDDAAFLYQSSNLEILDRLADLRSKPFAFLDRELGNLRSNFNDAWTFAVAKCLLLLRMKHPPQPTALYRSRLRDIKTVGSNDVNHGEYSETAATISFKKAASIGGLFFLHVK
jgi:hypothetical protein